MARDEIRKNLRDLNIKWRIHIKKVLKLQIKQWHRRTTKEKLNENITNGRKRNRI